MADVEWKDSPFAIVGIGASAGGLEALESVFGNLPPDPGCAIVIVTHLSPERRSLLPEIIARYTPMPVHIAADGVQVRPDAVYVMEEDGILDIAGGVLRMRKALSGRRERKPVDVFFAALAREHGEFAAGVVLSGGDGDGTLGVKAIHQQGGLTVAQTTDGTAPQYPSMPNSAIATGMVDLAIPAGEIGPRLAEFARGMDGLARRAGRAEAGLDGLTADRDAHAEISAILHDRVGHDFAGYKERTFLRRVHRRMLALQAPTIDSYLGRLRSDPAEVAALFQDLLINVTNFFRDPEAFRLLETQAIPELFAGRSAQNTVRVWVPGCATGEEVYSIAILLRERIEELETVPRVQVFATDIDETALSVARAGRYPEALLEGVSAARRDRFFRFEDGSYVLTKAVRDLCIFSPHSVIRDPPFSRLDLVSCRNLLIYFSTEVQAQVIPTFHYSLRPGGFLFLGTSENVSQFGHMFAPVDKKLRLFRNKEESGVPPRMPLTLAKAIRPPGASPPDQRRRPAMLNGLTLRHAVEAQVLDRHSPAHVVVDREGEVVFFSARTGRYLEATVGAPSRQLVTMARRGLGLDLRAVWREAVETGKRAVRENVVIASEQDRVQRITLTAEPFGSQAGAQGLFLIVFEDSGAPLTRDEAAGMSSGADEAVIVLEREMRETRERLESLIEEYETALEELKSSNEELVSVNEELQSANEEMEASKEELQSVNEELHTVNGELHSKVEDLDRANSDLTNLFESTSLATVFLDRDLRIRSFTPAVTAIFNVLPSDQGRPLTDLVSRLPVPMLTDDARSVLESGREIERNVKGEGDANYLLRLVPYRAGAGRVEGVVVTFLDITTLARAEAHQRVLIGELNHRVKNMLAVVISVAEQTYRGAADLSDFRERFVARVQGMARSFELLSGENWTEVSLQELATSQLGAFGLERITIAGPPLRLGPKQALSLGMVLHELATNAVKYGALGAGFGQVELEWVIQTGEREGQLVLTWLERGGPPVTEPTRRGFGLRLIEGETAHGLRGRATISYEPGGLVARLEFPAAPGTDDV